MNTPSASPLVLTWNNQKHKLAEVLQQAKMGAPLIQVKEDEIGESKLLAINTNSDEDQRFVAESELIFHKHDGKYVVFTGAASIARQKADPKYKGVIRGRLLSGVMLKKAREEPLPAFERPPEFSAAELTMGNYPPPRRYVDRDSGNIRGGIRFRDDRQGNRPARNSREGSEAWRPGFDSTGSR